MNLTELISVVTKENRISEHDIMKMISERADSGEEFTPVCIYRMIYSKVYGETISKELAQMLVKQMAVTDGSNREHGEKWPIEQTTAVGTEIGLDWTHFSKVDFYFIMNLVASDFSNLAEKVGYSDDPKFFAYMAKDWLEDADIPCSKKLYKYIFNVIM